MRAIRATFKGRVQGVNFRDFARRRALALGVSGSVSNLPNGSSVEVYGQGTEEALLRLIEALRDGPGLSRVDDVQVEWVEAQEEVSGFEVIW